MAPPIGMSKDKEESVRDKEARDEWRRELQEWKREMKELGRSIKKELTEVRRTRREEREEEEEERKKREDEIREEVRKMREICIAIAERGKREIVEGERELIERVARLKEEWKKERQEMRREMREMGMDIKKELMEEREFRVVGIVKEEGERMKGEEILREEIRKVREECSGIVEEREREMEERQREVTESAERMLEMEEKVEEIMRWINECKEEMWKREVGNSGKSDSGSTRSSERSIVSDKSEGGREVEAEETEERQKEEERRREEDREMRRCNVVIRGLEGEKSELEETAYIEGFLRWRVGVKCDVKEVRRSGPVLVVTLENEEMREEIMKNKSRLKGERIFIEKDLGWEDRKRQERMRKWAWDQRAEGRSVKVGQGRIKKEGRWWPWEEVLKEEEGRKGKERKGRQEEEEVKNEAEGWKWEGGRNEYYGIRRREVW